MLSSSTATQFQDSQRPKVILIQKNNVLTGTAGPQGPQGTAIQGPQGFTGSPGAPGIMGPQGITGAQGQIGDTGVQGSIGPQGMSLTGPQGIQGIQGPQGIAVVGPQGLQGPQGIATIGTQGPQGIAIIGPQGAQGIGSQTLLFSASTTTSQNVPVLPAFTTVLFNNTNAPRFNESTAYNPAQGRFTAPMDGLYEFFTHTQFQISIPGSETVTVFTSIFVDGASVSNDFRAVTTVANPFLVGETFNVNQGVNAKFMLTAGSFVDVNITFQRAVGSIASASMTGYFHGSNLRVL